MSGSGQAEAIVETTPSLKRKRFPTDQQEDLDALDHLFKRIKTAVPRTPYVLSTPSQHPYRYHSQQEANAWMMGRLWGHDEEPRQYRTFLYREPCQDCFELQAGEEDEPEPDRPKSQPAHTTTKKKMNLSGFKVKQVNGSTVSVFKKDSPNPSPIKQASEKPHGAKKPGQSTALSQTKGPKSPLRSSHNSRDEQGVQKASDTNTRSTVRHNPPSSTQKSESTQPKNDTSRPDSSSGTPHGLPPLLSPVDEPLGNPHGLPNILSPTLPSNIQAELDRLEAQHKRAESNASTSLSDRKSQTLTVSNPQSKNLDISAKAESRVQSESANGKSPKPEHISRPEEKTPSLIVKLKFSRGKIPTVKQILRLPPKRTNVEKKERQDTPREAAAQGQMKPVDRVVIKKKPIPKFAARRPPEDSAQPSLSTPSTKSVALPARVPEKRPRAEDDAALSAPAKRPKVSSALERPITPVQQIISSPSLSLESSAQTGQTQYITPKRDLKAVSMLRTQSAESYDATPGRSGSTPAGGRGERTGHISAPSKSKKQADISLLAQSSMKLNQMGRTLKHEATKILTAPGNKITKQDEKRAAVTNLECILSYMAAYYAQDLSLNLRGRAGEVEQTWKTLLPLCLSYARSTKDFKHLDGLRSYLSSVIASSICTHVSQRASSSRPHDSPQDVAHAELAKQHTSLAENFALLSDHTMKMHRHFTDARIALPMEDLQTMYKKTYAARESDARLVREPEKVNGTRMSGPYFLPLSTDTTPIQAVRFGLRFLAEYCEREKLEYSLRVSLDKPE